MEKTGRWKWKHIQKKSKYPLCRYIGEINKMTVEKVTIEDAEELLQIYAPYVK